MCRKVFLLISLLLVLSAASRAGAICFDANLLASYEPPEVNDLNTTPGPEDATLTATWVRGGENNVPPATEGEYVLKLDWTNEANPNKIQVRHDWKYTRFDLADANFIHADVYIAAESAMPDAGGMGIWDSGWSFPWIGADCEPPRVNEWYSIPYGVAALSEPNLDHIEALVFDKLAGTSGTIYVDNLRIGAEEPDCHCRRKIIFSGYTWSVLQSDYKIGAQVWLKSRTGTAARLLPMRISDMERTFSPSEMKLTHWTQILYWAYSFMMCLPSRVSTGR